MVGLVVAPGCSGGSDSDEGPACGNGKVEAKEECDGSDFGGATCMDFGFDGGDLSCSDCGVDTSTCVYLDNDGDGLTSDVEAMIGTDPAIADTDGDGFTDGEENAALTDPLQINSWPVTLQRWPNRLAQADADAVPEEGWAKGDAVKKLKIIDQYGQEVSLRQFYGYNIVLSVGARWCGPCNDAASSSQDLWMQYKDKGVIFLEMLLDGNTPGVKATPGDIKYWVNKYDLEFPVGSRFGATTLTGQITSLPTFLFIDRGLRVVQIDEGFGGDEAISAQLDTME